MLLTYLPILILLSLALLFPLGSIFVTSALGPKIFHKPKSEPYECGVPAVGSPRKGFAVHFYKIAILFLLFDVEAALLFPWAVMFRHKLETWGAVYLIGELAVFLVILMGGYLYAVKRGALEWE